jgi:hypothetical protein
VEDFGVTSIFRTDCDFAENKKARTEGVVSERRLKLVDVELADNIGGFADRANDVEDRVDLPLKNVNNVFGKIGICNALTDLLLMERVIGEEGAY